MNPNSISVESQLSFAQAIEGSAAPPEIINSLSMIDVFYFSFDGKKHLGQIVVNSELEDDVLEIFSFMEELRFPVGRVIPIVQYQWDDLKSMAANNSSGFNFRMIAGTAKLSLHALGRAVDINPVQNPVIYPQGLIAPAGAQYVPTNRGTFTKDNPVVQEFLKRGWHWGGNFDQPKDYHHFEKP